MNPPEILDPLWVQAVSAIDAGDLSALESLLAAHPELVRDRLDHGEGYFRQPYLLWFVAENPIRNGKLPENIARVTRAILDAARDVDSLQEQLDATLGLVSSGRIAREQGVQGELIDVLCDAGADSDSAMMPALAHAERAAAERLLGRGAQLTLMAAVCLERDDVERLARMANAEERQAALAGAALYGRVSVLALLIDLGVDVNAYSPPGFHPHGTALHHAVSSGSLDAVKVLVEAGADLGTRDLVYQGTPLGWAESLQRTEIADYLRSCFSPVTT
jgi:peptide-methionine (S)-S-oxide reductase